MAAVVEIVRGPEAGWRYVVYTAEARIGRGGGHQVKVQDPAWGDGHLRLLFRQGGYLVTNHMPHPVFLDGQLLPPKEQRNWYAGSHLQPTSATLLRLDVVETPAGPMPEGGVAAEPPGKKGGGGSKSAEWVALVVLIAAIGFLGYRHFRPPTVAGPEVEYLASVEPGLKAAEGSAKAGRQVGLARKAVGLAVYRESGNDLSGARRSYLDARELIAEARRLDRTVEPELDAALDFVVGRLNALPN